MSLDTTTGEVLTDAEVIEEFTPDEARAFVGRINHSVAISGDMIAEAYQRRIWKTLGYQTWADFTAAEIGPENLPSAARAVLAVGLRQAGMSLRAVAASSGMSKDSVARLSAGVSDETPETATGVDGKEYPSKVTRRESVSETVEYGQPEPTPEDLAHECDECGGSLTHWAGPGDAHGTFCHECDDTPEYEDRDATGIPQDPAPSPGADGEVEAATDGDEVVTLAGSDTAATSPSSKPPRMVTVQDFMRPVKVDSWLFGVESGVFWDVNDLASADAFLSWIDLAAEFAMRVRADQPKHLRLVGGHE